MADTPSPAALTALAVAPQFAFSIQNQGLFLGLHVNLPYASIVVCIPVDSVDAFADEFVKNMKELAAQARQQQSGLVVATEATLGILKGKK